EIRQRTDLDAETAEMIGVINVTRATVGGVSFDTPPFLSAVELALTGAEAPVKAAEPEAEFRFVIAEDEREGQGDGSALIPIAILDARGNRVDVMHDPMFGLLSPDRATRRATLGRLRRWFDCGP